MKPETESRRITRLHREWLAKRGLPAGNRFNRWDKPSAFAAEVPNPKTPLGRSSAGTRP